MRLLALDHSLHALYAALRGPRRAAPLPAWTRCPTFVLLRRAGWEIVSDELAVGEGALLADLLAGETVGTALATAAERGASEHDVHAWFQDWLQLGLFRGLS